MTFLFKYTNKKYLDRLIKNGKFRIGTLYDFRKNDEHGDVIGDPHEGIQKEILKTDKPEEIDVHSNTPEASFFLRNYPSLNEKKLINGAKIIIATSAGTSFEQTINSQNLFLFCMTSTFDKEVMKEFGYDVCIKIEHPEKFFSAISHTIRQQGYFYWSVPY